MIIKARILVVEDQAPTANLILDVLQAEGYGAQAVSSLAQARERLRKAPPELVILDRTLPDGDGADLLAEIRRDEALARLPVLILTARKDPADRVAGLRGGADDYVAKPFHVEELAARVGALLRRSGRAEEEPSALEAAGLKLDRAARTAWTQGRNAGLTAREFDLLWLLVRRRGSVLTRDFLLQHIWGYDQGAELTTKVIDVTLSHLRRKIGAPADKIAAVRGFGYRFDG
ncbi:MAG: response regulator transcription factor [Elusimicrobia bacterium]|nr:response regulator transcription factor [Elusimicrobiota bacterium]